MADNGPRITCVIFSSDGKKLASANAEGIVTLWDVRNRVMIGEPIRAHEAAVWGLAFSPGGNTLASASWDRTLILWDVNTRQQIGKKFRGHGDVVWRIAFSPDGKTLASASEDTTVILWDVATHQPRGVQLEGHSKAVPPIDHTWDGAPIPQSWQPRYTAVLRIANPDLWAKRACEMSTRNLTCEEWRQFVGDLPYRKACPDIARPDNC